MKKHHAQELSRNQSILRFDVILPHDWPIEQCLLHIRVFFGGKTKRACFDLFIHRLIKQIANTHRNHFSRSYENHSNQIVRVRSRGGKINQSQYTFPHVVIGLVHLLLLATPTTQFSLDCKWHSRKPNHKTHNAVCTRS